MVAAMAAADRTTATDADTTYAGNLTTATGSSSNKSGVPVKKKVGKTKLTAKEKKDRSVRCFFHYCMFWLKLIHPLHRLRLKKL